MTEKHKKFITDHFDELAANVLNCQLAQQLVDKQILSHHEVQQLSNERTRLRQATSTLNLLMEKEDRAFGVLVKWWWSTSQPHIADLQECAGKIFKTFLQLHIGSSVGCLFAISAPAYSSTVPRQPL